jgi:hypothetical protein
MNKNALVWTIVVIVVVVAGVAIYEQNKSGSSGSMMTNNSSPTPTAMMSVTPTPSEAMTSPSPTAAARLSYGAALNTYKNRMQLLACHGSPGTMVVTKGSPVMFDNRDHNTHLVKVGSQSVSVPGLDYELLYPNTKGNFQVTCDGGGAGLLEVE